MYPRILREARKEIAWALRQIFVPPLATGEVPGIRESQMLFRCLRREARITQEITGR